MVAAREAAVRFLANRLRPVPTDLGAHVRKLIADLDSAEFPVRKAALRELEKVGADAEPALRRALKGTPSTEVRRRVTGLLERLSGVPSPELRRGRALQVLELVGTPEARRLLESLARGAPEARLTQEAEAALRRWRPPPP
jgi:hypothetical protein